MRGPYPYVSPSKRVPHPPPGYVSVPEAALRAGISEGCLRQRVQRNKLPALRQDGHVYLAEDVVASLTRLYAELRLIAQRAREEQRQHGGRPEAPAAAPSERGEAAAGEVRS